VSRKVEGKNELKEIEFKFFDDDAGTCVPGSVFGPE
jgi:hypothetical protein